MFEPAFLLFFTAVAAFFVAGSILSDPLLRSRLISVVTAVVALLFGLVTSGLLVRYLAGI